MQKQFKVIAFDADDTLWSNEPHFRIAEQEFCTLLKDYDTQENIYQLLLKTEIKNVPKYGYGAKGFTLSLMETALTLTKKKLQGEITEKILAIGTQLLSTPIVLLQGVEETLTKLQPHYKLVMATKGDLSEQTSKIKRSPLEHYFHHIEIMNEKDTHHYRELMHTLRVKPEEFLMIGNSPKSDIQPVIELGANAIHIPYKTTWIHEEVTEEITSNRLYHFHSISEIPTFLGV
ncbi:MAG: HAD family hydrolase [Bacteroidaceae bacterium]|nr:HAD family hydrolase [Bacteroidaceae bacterium]